jgi:hypothetical protein
MNHIKQTTAIQIATGKTTAFRLSPELLKTVDAWCYKNDITRSQFFRHSIMDRVKVLDIEMKEREERNWSHGLYNRVRSQT